MQGPQNRSHKTSGRPGVGVIPVDHGQKVSRCQQQDQLPIVASGCGGAWATMTPLLGSAAKASNAFSSLKADMLSPAAGLVRSNSA